MRMERLEYLGIEKKSNQSEANAMLEEFRASSVSH